MFIVIITCPNYYKRMCYHLNVRLKGMVSVMEIKQLGKNYKCYKIKVYNFIKCFTTDGHLKT